MSLKQDLPEGANEKAVENLIDELADCLNDLPSLKDCLDQCNLQPTTRARGLAARAAVMVLLAHDLGQSVAEDSDGNVAADDAKGDREVYEVAMIEIQETAHKALMHLSDPAALRGEMAKVHSAATVALKNVDDNDE